MTDTTESVENTKPVVPSFRLKGGLFPMTLLEIARYERESFETDLRNKVAEAPAFFERTPVVLAFDGFDGDVSDVPLSEVVELCREFSLLPVAIRTAEEALSDQALECGLALMRESRSRDRASPEAEPEMAVNKSSDAESRETVNVTPLMGATSQTKIVTSPVRSGQQVYAPGGDLVVLSSVSAGAEILADGNIHIYGALRGRALAGVLGNTEAKVFCQSLEAELVSIAGNFKLDDDLQGELWKKPVQIGLDDQTLSILPLV